MIVFPSRSEELAQWFNALKHIGGQARKPRYLGQNRDIAIGFNSAAVMGDGGTIQNHSGNFHISRPQRLK